MSKKQKEASENILNEQEIEKKAENDSNISQGADVEGHIIDLEEWAENQSKEKAVKGKYDGQLPLVSSSKEAKDFMNGLLADEARAAGADALVRGVAIKRQYNTMKRLAYWLSGLAVVSSAMSGYLIHNQQNQIDNNDLMRQQQADNYEAMLRQTVSALPKEQIQYARVVYANSIINTMQQNPNMSVLEATKSAVQSVGDNMLPSVKRVISSDVMTMAKAYEDMGVSRDNYHNVMVGYAKNVVSTYANHTTSQETVKNNILYYLQSAHMR